MLPALEDRPAPRRRRGNHRRGRSRRQTSRSSASQWCGAGLRFRRRRGLPDEEKALLNAAGSVTHDAGPPTQWLIIAAIETGCRVGELLALQWADVDLKKRTVFVRVVERGARKTGRSRLLPMSARLPPGHARPCEYQPDGYVSARGRDGLAGFDEAVRRRAW